MYTLLELQAKTLAALKEIGHELNVIPAGHRGRRKSWIDAIEGVNPPPLKLLEVSPGVEVDRAQEPIIETVKSAPAVEVEQAQEPPIESPAAAVECPSCGGVHALYTDKDCLDKPLIRCLHCDYCRIKNYPGPIRFEAQEPIRETVETSPGVDLDDELPECSNCFGDGYVEDEFGSVKFCQCEIEPRLSRQRTERAIASAAKISLNPKSDQNPILTGIALSDRFLARYAPPRSEFLYYEIPNGYKADTDGQLSLLESHVVTEPEPPDPDDFESLDAFREAIARWDAQNPEPPAVTTDSMCEWAPCPQEWYEPEAEILPLKASSMIELPEQSEVMELSPQIETSSTSDFFIPTFGRWGDRPNNGDEPPDTGILVRLPKPKPPTFPPQAASWTQVGRKLDTSWTPLSEASRSPATTPKLFHRVVAGTSNQPARSPPGGDV